MLTVCIDTQILIWGVQGHATSGQEGMIGRAKALLVQFEKENTRVIIPSVVTGEFLLKIPEDEHPRYQDIISRRFIVMPYDLRASLVFSTIWHRKKRQQDIEAIKQSGATRNEIRADMMIVSTAIASGAACIYGHDQGMKKISDGFIEFKDISEMLMQFPLPENE